MNNTAEQLDQDVQVDENIEQTKEQTISLNNDPVEIEVVDDTPAEDRNRPKRAENTEPNIPDDDEINSYKGDVQKRIKQLKYEYHEERRQKEEAKRLSDEAVSATQKLIEENKKLRKTIDDGEGVLVEQAKGRVAAQLDKAKQEYKEAYEAGDPDKLIEAQEKLTAIQNEKYRVDNYKPPVRAEEPDNIPPVSQAPAQPKVKEPTGRDKEWLEANTDWFQKDGHEDMTGYAMGIHQKLVKAGINPQLDTEEYYRRIDQAMEKAFPEHFNRNKQSVETEEVEAPQRTAGNVVAPVNRSAKKPRKVQLTSTQIGLAKRLGLTPEQYAQQLLKESLNG
jgi:NOL1/NOP2/fmu family ribosome biogenesis protein